MVKHVAKQYRIPVIVPWMSLLLLALFLLSLTLFLVQGREIRRKVFFFPQYKASMVAGESRNLPVRDDLEGNIELLVDEILLGPIVVTNERLFPEGTKLRTVMVRDKTVYIDLSIEAVLDTKNSELSFQEALGVLRKTVKFNYPSVEKIIITIDGETPRLSPSKG
ncbi:GerMN domain-containing protein [Sediminispirochaeta bajacaliforniensis]|uniref:GerMN domain-containing protein n=1 Tax=Sediminispirochaeta bajacaliforniensis TaxID=148 RepID=UPI00036973FE|nr:GerMN domain-containing protein [Sediminispirochaeta bajacaliforniensis]